MMSKSVTARLKIRKSFERFSAPVEMPNLIELQKSSYEKFLQSKIISTKRFDQGLQAAFNSVFPIKDFIGRAQLEFYCYDFDVPKYDVDECRQRGLTYSSPLRVTFRLVVWDMDANPAK